jgi:hypothetical protein
MSLVFSGNLIIHKSVSSPLVFILPVFVGAVIIPLFEIIKGRRKRI